MVDIKKLQKLTKDLSILYVEDDIAIQEAMSQYLEKLFHVVVVASNGEEGLVAFKKKTFNIVITDLSMPKMDGIEMIKKIKEINKEQPIVITTAHEGSSYLMEAIKAHIDGYILKPFEYNSLNFELYKVAEKINKFAENEAYKEYLQDMLKIQTQEMQDNYEQTIYSIVDLIEQRDTYTAGHSKRVSYYCKLIAQEMGYSNEECTLLQQAAMLHDVGKIETPDAVLLNPKKLNSIEYKLIQEHVLVGYKLLNSIPMFKAFAEIVKSHHERYDGSGYPDGLKGDEIPKLSRIMLVSDAFDAMTTNRIYKGRKSIDEAIEELQMLSQKQFHPEVVISAVVVLRDIILDENINQLPKTKLEEERFAYFYNDNLTHLYNQNYLEVVLMKNQYENLFQYMELFSIGNFSSYNKKHGWEEGDKILKEFANILSTSINQNLIFRIFGDDFIILSKTKCNFTIPKEQLDDLMQKNSLHYRCMSIDLEQRKIEKLTDIEMLQASF